jgi:hypothetical protein
MGKPTRNELLAEYYLRAAGIAAVWIDAEKAAIVPDRPGGIATGESGGRIATLALVNVMRAPERLCPPRKLLPSGAIFLSSANSFPFSKRSSPVLMSRCGVPPSAASSPPESPLDVPPFGRVFVGIARLLSRSTLTVASQIGRTVPA